MDFPTELRTGLEELAPGAEVEVRENGRRVASFLGMSWEVRGSPDKPLLHLWSEQFNLTRRVLAITDHTGERLALSVERFGRAKPDRLEFVRLAFRRNARELSREEFREYLRHFLAEQFPDETVESLAVAPDLEHSLSGNYVRGVLRRGSARIGFLAVPDGESADTAENSLTYALLWLTNLRRSGSGRLITCLRLILPENASHTVAHRVAALDSRIALELYEHKVASETLERIDPRITGNLNSWLVPPRDGEALLNRAKSQVAEIMMTAPQSIALHAVPHAREVWLRFRGLPFARWHEGRIFFGLSEADEELNAVSLPALKRLLHELEIHRHPLASDTQHSLYRAHPERWLESIIREDITRIDPKLDPRFVYAQVFANAGDKHGILDLLAVTRLGRLAILELKAGEHIHLPLQAADYWLRVRRQLESGEIARYGYFPRIELQKTPPVVYLVAPALRFHPTTDDLLRYLCPELEVVRIGLGEDWRRGLRVVTRQ